MKVKHARKHNDSNPKNKYITIRVTLEERNKIHSLANREGLSLSAFLVKSVLGSDSLLHSK